MKAKRKTQHHTKTTAWLKVLQSSGIPHRISLTNNTTLVEVIRANGDVNKWIISDRNLSFKSLGFIGRTKADARNCGLPKVERPRPRYFQFFSKQAGTHDDIVEVDVNKAYWNIAHQKGYIGDKIYQEGLSVDKMTRLIATGAVATVRANYDFIDGEYIHTGDDFDPVTRSYFFDIAHELGEMMGECLLSVGIEHCYFFWVDAFFVSKAAAGYIEQYFEGKGLGVKYKPIRKMEVEHISEGWKVSVYEEKKEEIHVKPFFFPVHDSRKRLIARTKRLIKTGKQKNKDF